MISLRLAGHRVAMRCGPNDMAPNTGLITRVWGDRFSFIDDMEPFMGEQSLSREFWEVIRVWPNAADATATGSGD